MGRLHFQTQPIYPRSYNPLAFKVPRRGSSRSDQRVKQMFHGAASAGGGNVRPDRPPNSAKTVVIYIHLFHVSTTSFWTYMSAAWAQLEFNFGQQEFVLGIVGTCSPCWACVGPNLCGRCPHTGPGCVMLDTTCAHTAKFDPSRLRLGQVGPCPSPRVPCYPYSSTSKSRPWPA